MKHLPSFLVLTMFIALVVAACSAKAVTPQSDTFTPNVTCANGFRAFNKCPPGLEIHGVHLAFSDLITGPDTGLGDGLGSGAIVTVWGYNLGSTQGTSTIQYCDSASTCRAGHVYYWKNADGQLPSGPANLYESHRMQEVAFSIPDSAMGAGTIRVTVNGNQSTLPFTVRSGNIYHVASGGSNSNPCSFAQPCAYINGDINPSSGNGGLGNGGLLAGDVVYSHGVLEPSFQATDGRHSGMYLRSAAGTLDNQIAIVAYPDDSNFSRVVSQGYGVQPYLTSSIVLSKYLISVGHADPSDPPNAGTSNLSDTHIGATPNGRAIANKLVQNANTCFTGWSGSISSGGNGGDNFKAFGNHIDSLGCNNSSRFAHTIYMSIRNEATTGIAPWEFAYNYLSDNNVFYGIHFYDEQYNGDCGDMTGTLRVHNNVIVNQRGAGINIGSNDASGTQNLCWTADIEINNNVLINVGLGVPAEDGVVNAQAIQVGGDLGGNLTISNNTVYGHGESTSLGVNADSLLTVNYILHDPSVTVNNNVFVQTSNVPWLISSEAIAAENNSFWSAATNNANSPPSWTNNITTNPLVNVSGSQISVGADSPLKDSGSVTPYSIDIYGAPRGTTIGAVQ